MKRTILLLVALFVSTMRPHQATAAVATVAGDAYTSSTLPNTNYGPAVSLLIKGPPAVAAVANVYVQFDMSSLPPGTVGNDIAKATLTVAVNTVTVAGSFDVVRVTSAWTEAGVKFSAAPTISGTPEVSGIAVALTDKKDFKTIDVTQLVKDWLNNVLPNNGIALVPNVAGVSAQFDSKESTATSHTAQLDIELGTVANFSGNLSGDVTGTQTNTTVGRINNSPLGSLLGATSGKALTFNGTNWSPSSVVNSLTAGSGLSASSSTGNVTMSVPAGGVTNSMLANSGVTVTAGSGLSGGGTVALGGSTTLNNTGVLSVGASAPLASSGGQNPSVSLTGTVPVANGGTGATTASSARGNLGAAARGANFDITSLRAASESGNNTAVGSAALAANTTGTDNAAVGYLALWNNTTGSGNSAVGSAALIYNTSGTYNTAVGVSALYSNTTGSDNTVLGSGLNNNTTGNDNTAVGGATLLLNTTGFRNTAVGTEALLFNTTGSDNIGLGRRAGQNLTTGDNNINIGNTGVAAESNTIRLGTSGTQTATYIAGINGATSSGGVAVLVNASGQLGTITSSARFKDDIQDMGNSTSALMKLRPVRFRYKQDIDPSGLEQYGLVAEEVAKVYPDLVVYDDKGQPQTVRYHFINAMLLNEVQKQARQIAAQQRQIETLTAQSRQATAHAQQIEALTVRLEQLEAGLNTSAPKVTEASSKTPKGL